MESVPYLPTPMAAYALMGLLSLALAAMLPGLPGRGPWYCHVAVIVVANLLTLGAALRRAQRSPEERTGWYFFIAAVVVVFLGNALWATTPVPVERYRWLRLLLYGGNPVSGVLMAVAVWTWPWRSREGRTSLDLLGSLVFCLSFLLLPWLPGYWDPLDGHNTFRVVALTLGSRLILVGGLAAFLVSADPRRLRGPLGWLLLNCTLLFLQTQLIAHGADRLDVAARSPWLAATPLITGALWMVPFCGQPVEAPASGRPMPAHLPGLALHVPFLAATTLLVVSIIGGNPPRPAVLLVFLAMAAALVLRQFLLQEQLAAANREMEARVLRRTQDLERMQDVVLLNERLNAAVVLGAGLVHDLNKGLGTILSAAEVLRMELERRMQVSGFAVEAIIEAVQRSARLSSQVMDFSRQLQEEGDIRDLRRELAALEGLLKLLVPCGVQLLLQPGQEPAPVRIHTEDLKQILVNLVTNARDAMPQGGTIRLVVGKEVRTGETYLDVEDTGTGIPEAIRGRVFEPFFTTKEPGTASGLGLASVRVLLDKVKGRVEVSSALGSGTRFRLLFPAAVVHV